MPAEGTTPPPGIAFALPNFAAYAGLLPPKWVSAPKVFFRYTVNYGLGGLGANLAVSAQNQFTSFTVQNDADFLVTKIYGRAVVVGATALLQAAVTPIMVNITDSSGAIWFDNPQFFDQLCTFAQQPDYFDFPRAIRKNTTVNVFLTNLIATAAQVQLSFCGFKIYTGLTWSDLGF